MYQDQMKLLALQAVIWILFAWVHAPHWNLCQNTGSISYVLENHSSITEVVIPFFLKVLHGMV